MPEASNPPSPAKRDPAVPFESEAKGTRARAPEDPLIRKWQISILQRDRAGVEFASSAFLAGEDTYRDRLVKLASEDAEPRIRGFTVTLLSRLRKPPPEEVFVLALGDAAEPPRESAMAALGKVGTRACLEALDRAALADPSERLRGVAAEAARVVRAK